MIVRMVHPDHGATHVYDVAELDRHRKLGWLPEDEANARDSSLAQCAIRANQVIDHSLSGVSAELEQQPAKRKPGRPRKVR